MGFCGQISETWRTSNKDSKSAATIYNKSHSFAQKFTERLAKVQIEHRDAIKLIRDRDAEDTFFYCDPPYFNSDMGHYGGYSERDYEALLIALSGIKGKFMLSSYPSAILKRYVKEHGWHQREYEMHLSVSASGKRKTEVLTTNYPFK